MFENIFRKSKPGSSPEKIQGSKSFDERVVARAQQSEMQGGMKAEDIRVGQVLILETRNRIYRIERKVDGFYISGHPEWCAVPTKAQIQGSTFGRSSSIRPGFIGVGMNLECVPLEGPGHKHPEAKVLDAITTSSIKGFHIEGEVPKAGAN